MRNLADWFSILKTDIDFEHNPDRPTKYGRYVINEDKIIMNLSSMTQLLNDVGEGDYDITEEEALERIGDSISHEAIHAAQSKVGEIDSNTKVQRNEDGTIDIDDLTNLIRRKAFRLLFNEITARLPEANNDYRIAVELMWRDLGGDTLINSTYHAQGNDLYANIFNNALNEMITNLMRR